MKFVLPLPFIFISFLVFSQNAIEKVHLHTDRDVYVAGDTLWAKGYVFDAQSLLPSQQSKVLYLTLVDTGGTIILQNKTQINEGQSDSYVLLPKNLEGKTYRLLAHTHLMQSFDNDFFFQKSIEIADRRGIKEIKSSNLDNSPSVQFFPEGGNLVNGVNCRVAFKAVLTNGQNLDFEGHIENQQGEMLNQIATDYLGMGTFSFTPEAGQQYKAVMTYGKQKYTFLLPTAQAESYVLRADNVQAKDGIYMEVQSNEPKKQPLFLVVQQQGQVIFEQNFTQLTNIQKFFLKNEQIPQDGIVQVSLFDASRKPLCERLVFVFRGKNSFDISVKTETPITERQKQHFEIKAAPNASLSVSVIDVGQVEKNPETPNIYAYLLLNSDLKGYIEKPNTYFEMDKQKAKFYLDNLMLTQGWRRFVPNTSVGIEQALTLRGKALKGNKPAKTETIILSIWSKKGLKVGTFETDEQGSFEVVGDWEGKLNLIATDTKGREIALQIDDPTKPQTAYFQIPKRITPKPTFIDNALQMQEDAILLEEVTTKAERINPLKEDSRRMMYNGEPDISIEITKDITSGATSLSQMLEGRIVGIMPGFFSQIANKNPVAAVDISFDRPGGAKTAKDTHSSDLKDQLGRSVLILVDGVIVPTTFINSIFPSMVERVDLLRDVAKTSIYGLQAGDGKVINILTKRSTNAIEGMETNKSSQWIGYNTKRQFYSPRYDKPQTNTQPDRRATLYWNANVKTDANGKASVDFYNSDIAQKFHINIQGTDGKGNVGSLLKIVK